jgi:hypothetical protein
MTDGFGKPYLLVLGVLGVWRITHLLNAEDGPWDLLARLRRLLRWRLLDCFYCLSLWVALPFAVGLGRGVLHQLLLWPALSAGALVLERVTAPHGALPAAFAEDDASFDERKSS